MMAIFEGDPSGSPSMTVITVKTITFDLENQISWGSHNFLASAQQPNGDAPMMMRIGIHKSHVEYLMISYLLSGGVCALN